MPAKKAAACPHLGLIQDRATHMSFPSVSNHCMNCRKPTQPAFVHQQEYCLTVAHVDCPLYAAAGRGDLPPELGGRNPMGRKWFWGIAALVAAGAIMAAVISSSSQAARVVESASPVPTVQPIEETFAPPATSTQAPPPTPTLVAVQQPVVPLQLPGQDLTTESARFAPGTSQSYLVHVVSVSETLDLIAANYNTTLQALIAVNYKIQPPVWVDAMIVVPPGASSAEGLPAFTVHVVEQESVSSLNLADELFADEAALELYNGCNGPCEFVRGNVLLVLRTP